MSTKLKGDIAVQAAILQALKRGWGVLQPVGDRDPYDLVFDVQGRLVKVQVKSSWFQSQDNSYVVDNRRTKTNRRKMIRSPYSRQDFNFALIYLAEIDLFYVMPSDVFIAYASQIYLVETDKRQRRPRSASYRDAWNLISEWATQQETVVLIPVKFGEAAGGGNPEPSSEAILRRCRDLMAGIFASQKWFDR